jgi:regulatory protein
VTTPPRCPSRKGVNSIRRGSREQFAKSGSSKLTFRSKSGKPRAFLNEADLYDYAIKALARAMRTEAELCRQMQQRVEPGELGYAIIETVVARLKEQGFLDDKSFAETYARLRQENEKLGERRVRNDLRQKGIASSLIASAVDARYEQTNEESLARQHLERKRIRKPQNDKETARVMRRLVAAGFTTAVIHKILREWDIPDESLAALDTLQDDAHEE